MQFPSAFSRALLALCFGAAVLSISSCSGGGSLGNSEQQTAGNFQLLSTNISNGMVWELNRTIVMEFNHPIDPSSISFSSVLLRATDSRILGRPVTGSFVIAPNSGNKILEFRPACPTNENNDNGGLLPGGYEYEFTLPTQGSFGTSVLRDKGGHPLSKGTTVEFRTPIFPAEPLFIDTSTGPPALLSVDFPGGLNFFSRPSGDVEIRFNQAIDGRELNLSSSNVFILYSDDTVDNIGPNPQPSDFPATNTLPGQLLLLENCTETGATVLFKIAGVLPPDRYLRLTVRAEFTDIIGQRNLQDIQWPDYATPTLASIYQDPTWNPSEETIDEFQDFFDNSTWVDGEANLSLPPATLDNGQVSASFDFPGQFVPPDADFAFTDQSTEIFTDGQTLYTDSNNRTFLINNGVLNVNDFYLAEGSTLRGRGRNPLVIYATGTVTIDGKIDVSGNHSHWPTALNSPQFPEGGALGECGGGQGGDASQITDRETPRGESGDGPFGLIGGGGQGGESGYQQSNGGGGGNEQVIRMVSGGGGGGGFTLTENLSITWDKWDVTTPEVPADFDNEGPDHDEAEHPFFFPDEVLGAEPGLRGSSYESNVYDGTGEADDTQGTFGMEDRTVDTLAFDGEASNQLGDEIDPLCDQPGCPNWEPGHLTDGPDPGAAGAAVFSSDGDNTNDFWGRRFDPTSGSYIIGELLAPWGGAGGGAGGDSQILVRKDLDGVNGLDPLNDFFPDRPFLGNTHYYRKGAPGGGGGGQLLIMAIGDIVLGPNVQIWAKGGAGYGGESVGFTYWQISGSGGGSGGHVVLHTASRLDISQIPVSGVNSEQDLVDLIANRSDHIDIVRAIGGRRGWSASRLTKVQNSTVIWDGNGDFMIGRGGAGANGLLQIHVPNPATDIIYSNSDSFDAIVDAYIKPSGVLDLDRLEGVWDIFSAPRPYILIPFFSSGSQYQSRWVDTGLAYQRLDPNNLNDNYPDYARSDVVAFSGVDPAGYVESTSGKVNGQPSIAEGPTSAVSFGSSSLTIPLARSHVPAFFLRHPEVLIGYEVMPDDTSGGARFEITAATYDQNSDELDLMTRSGDGNMLNFLNAGNPTWAIVVKFFRLSTLGVKDNLPGTASVQIEFQGADESFAGSNEPGVPLPGVASWTADLSELQGKRFIRYRLTFNINADNAGLTLTSPRPSLDYFKLPFVW